MGNTGLAILFTTMAREYTKFLFTLQKAPASSNYEAFSHCVTSLDLLELGTVILQLIVKKGCLNNAVYWENMLLKLLQAK